MKPDLKGKIDLPELMGKFYAKATEDPIIGKKFTHIDIQEHIPKIVEFWSTIIFYEGSYKGSPFDKHIPLYLEKKDFEQWLFLFEETVLENYEGTMANEIIERAKSIGRIFLFKIESLERLD